MTYERPAILSHASNAELVASYTQPQPGQPEKVLVSSSGTSHQVSSQVICAQKKYQILLQWIIGGNQGDHIRPLRPSAHNTELYVDSNNSLWVQVGDHPGGETEWFLSDPITNPSDQFHYKYVYIETRCLC